VRSGSVALRTMQALETVDDAAEVAAMLVGTIYELAYRLDVSPRSIADNAFCSLQADESWHETVMPALRTALGRD
jgi:hypothetical protein